MERRGVKTALLLVDHGSVRAEANALLAEVARLVREASGLEIVEHAHMELAEPTIAQGFDACVAAGARMVIVHPYFLAPGRHSTQDIPRLTASAAARHPDVRYNVSEPLGLHAKIAEVVLERAAQAGGGDTGSVERLATLRRQSQRKRPQRGRAMSRPSGGASTRANAVRIRERLREGKR